MLPLIRQNASKNKAPDFVKITELKWYAQTQLYTLCSLLLFRGEPVDQLSPPFDIILLSDGIAGCYEESYKALVDTLWMLSNEKTDIILCFEKRFGSQLY